MIVFTIAAAGLARVSGIGTLSMPKAQVISVLALTFTDRADGAIVVSGAPVRSGVVASPAHEIAALAPGTNGFVRGTLRGLVRERRRAGFDEAMPFELTRWSNGTLSLSDPTTGRRVDLDSFGPSNSGVFAGFLQAEDAR
jgi:putative photosynthetic complex assembly protein